MMAKKKVPLANALFPIAIVLLADLVEQLQSDNTRIPFTRQFFVPSVQHAQKLRQTGTNAQHGQQPFGTVTMNGGQQFVLVPRQIFLQNRHLFVYRRHLPSPSKFRIRPNIVSSNFKSESKFNKMPMLSLLSAKEAPNLKWTTKSSPKQHALPIAATNAKSVLLSESNALATSSAADGTKSAFLPSLTSRIQNSLPQIRVTSPQNVFPFRPPNKLSKIRPPIRENSPSAEHKLAEMARKRDEFFKKQQKELKMMRQRIEKDRRRMEAQRRQRILEEEAQRRNRQRLRPLTQVGTVPAAPAFGTLQPQHLQQPIPPVLTTTFKPFPPLLTSPGAAQPPGQLPPSDQVIDQLNNARDFIAVANRLRLMSDQFQTQKVHANL